MVVYLVTLQTTKQKEGRERRVEFSNFSFFLSVSSVRRARHSSPWPLGAILRFFFLLTLDVAVNETLC